MKKIIKSALAVALALVMVFSAVACGSGGGGGGGGGGGTQAPPTPAGIAAQPQAPALVIPEAEDNELEQTRTSVLTLTWAHTHPAQHHHQTGIIEPFVEAFREATEGMVDIIVHPGSALTTGVSALDDVISGAIDIIWTVPGWTPGRMPLTEIFEFPGMFNDAEEMAEVFWDLYESNPRFVEADFSDFVLFNAFSTDTHTVWTRGTPARLPADLRGRVMRAPGPTPESMLQTAGAATVNFPVAELYDNISRGVADGCTIGFSAIVTFSLWDLLDYGVVNLPMYVSPHIFAISHHAWNQLNEFEQAAFQRLTGRTIAIPSAQHFDAVSHNGLDQIRSNGMIELNELTPQEIAVWDNEVFGPTRQIYLDMLEGRGLPAYEIYDEIIALRDARRAR